MRTAIVLLFLATLLPAQTGDDRPAGPRQLWDRFFELTNAANEAQDDEERDVLLSRAGRLFELEDLPAADRVERGRAAVKFLHGYVNRLTSRVPTAKFPLDSAGAEFVFQSEHGPITATRQKDGSWLFAAETRRTLRRAGR